MSCLNVLRESFFLVTYFRFLQINDAMWWILLFLNMTAVDKYNFVIARLLLSHFRLTTVGGRYFVRRIELLMLFLQVRQHLYSILCVQLTRVGISGVRALLLTQIYRILVSSVGQKKGTCWSHSGQIYHLRRSVATSSFRVVAGHHVKVCASASVHLCLALRFVDAMVIVLLTYIRIFPRKWKRTAK